MKSKLAKIGVRVVSVCQDIPDGPIGHMLEGIFECIDQYESEINGVRTSAAMREVIRQGYFSGITRSLRFCCPPLWRSDPEVIARILNQRGVRERHDKAMVQVARALRAR